MRVNPIAPAAIKRTSAAKRFATIPLSAVKDGATLLATNQEKAGAGDFCCICVKPRWGGVSPICTRLGAEDAQKSGGFGLT
jgi:hypothetical protein